MASVITEEASDPGDDKHETNSEDPEDCNIKVEHLSPVHSDSEEWWEGQACLEQSADEALSFEKAKELLENYEGKICIIHAALPKAGQAYLYDVDIIGDIWENDHYEWTDPGTEYYPKDKPLMAKITSYIMIDACPHGSKDFQRITYSLLARPNVVLVYYMGDHSVYKKASVSSNKSHNDKFESIGMVKRETSGREEEEIYTGKSMDYIEASEMLENYKGCVSRTAAQFPKAGEIYYYDTNTLCDAWKDDGYLWRNCGKRVIPKKNPTIEKTYFAVRLNKWSNEGCAAFQRIVFKLLKRPYIVLVQYSGDESIWQATSSIKDTNTQGGTRARKPKPVFMFTPEELADHPKPVTCTDASHQLTFEEAGHLLRNSDDHESPNRPYQPKAGEAYIFHCKGKMREAWKSDGYDWQNFSPTYHPRNKPMYSKKVSFIKQSSEAKGSKLFQKHVFCLLDKIMVVLVHYTGDEDVGLKQNKGIKRKADDESPLSDEKSCDEQQTDEIDDFDDESDEKETGVRHRSLKLQEILDILHNYKGNVSQSRAVRPKAGEIYVFDTDIIGDDWKCDNYVWRNSGTNFQPKKNPKVRKVFYSIRLNEKKRGGSKVFQKTVYTLIERPNIIMVHYSGDESVYRPLMHGNRKHGYSEYTRTCPSVMASIKKALTETSGTTPKNTMKHLQMAYNLDDMPRNLDQIRNTKRLLQKKNTDSSQPTSHKVMNIIHQASRDASDITTLVITTDPVSATAAVMATPTTKQHDTMTQEIGLRSSHGEEDQCEQPWNENTSEIESSNQQTEFQPETTLCRETVGTAPFLAEPLSVLSTSGSVSPARAAILSRMDKEHPIIIQALDPRPEVCQVQLDLLGQQRRNLQLQEKKLLLEIKRLEGGNQLVDECSNIPEENVIYVQDANAFTEGAETPQLEQVIYIEPGEGFDATQYAAEYSTS